MSADLDQYGNGEEQRDPLEFDPLAMIEMWEDMDALVKRWELEHGATSNIASIAFKEYASTLIIKQTQ